MVCVTEGGRGSAWAEPLPFPPQILAGGWSKILALCALLFQRGGPRVMRFPRTATKAMSMSQGGAAGIITLHIVKTYLTHSPWP